MRQTCLLADEISASKEGIYSVEFSLKYVLENYCMLATRFCPEDEIGICGGCVMWVVPVGGCVDEYKVRGILCPTATSCR